MDQTWVLGLLSSVALVALNIALLIGNWPLAAVLLFPTMMWLAKMRRTRREVRKLKLERTKH
jgi:hypothetical protein